MYYVYKLTNQINGKFYIGKTNNTEIRWSGNGTQYRRSPKLFAAIQKYGWDNFTKEVLMTASTDEQISELESFFIRVFEAQKFGYNIADGGSGGRIYDEHPRGMLGKSHSEETKRKMSKRMSGSNNPFYGKRHLVHPKGASKKILILNQNGEVEKEFPTNKELREYIGCSPSFLSNIKNTGKPIASKKFTKLNGKFVVDADNTEITTKIKEFVAS